MFADVVVKTHACKAVIL